MTYLLVGLPAALLASFMATANAAERTPWLTNMEEARETAAADQKNMFLLFTGSDWCAPCILLEEEVLSSPKFLEYAEKRLVLVELDFPLDEELISGEQAAHNEQWSKRFGVGGYPTVLLVNAALKPYAETGYRAGGPALYLDYLEALRTVPATLKEIMAEAGAAKGLERAVLLDKALSVQGGIVDRRAFEEEIIALLTDEEQGQQELRSKYIFDEETVASDSELRKELTALYEREMSPAEKISALGELIDNYHHVRKGNAINEAANAVTRLAMSSGESEKDRAIDILDRLIDADGFTSHLEQNFLVAKAAILASGGDIEAATAQIEMAVRLVPEKKAYRDALMVHIRRTAEHFAQQ